MIASKDKATESFFGFLNFKKNPDTSAAFILLAPMLLFFSVSVVYPFLKTVWISFYDIHGLGAPVWLGLGNYFLLFKDPSFIHAMLATLGWTFGGTFLSVGAGWGLALLCSLAPKATLVFRVIIFAIYGISETVSGFIWLGIFHPDKSGLLNTILVDTGLIHVPQAWLGDVNTAFLAVIVAYSWTQVGLPLMTCFSSIQAIPKVILEAARVDGVRAFSKIRYIVMPLSLPGLKVAIFINLLASLKAFDMIYVLTNGGPLRSTETVGFFMYRESMAQFKLGYGAAATVILVIAILVLSVPAIMKRTGDAK